MGLEGRGWIAAAAGVAICACLTNVLVRAQHCPLKVQHTLEVFNGTALAVVVGVFFVALFQCARCLCCLRAEPLILLIVSGVVFAATAALHSLDGCAPGSGWLIACGGTLGLSVANGVLSWCF